MSISENYCNTGEFYCKDQMLLDALHSGFRSVWTNKPEEDRAQFTEAELERHGREVRHDEEWYDAHLRPP